MPYITQERREQMANISSAADYFFHENYSKPGDLAFLFSDIIDSYLSYQKKIGFASISQAIAELECTKLELYRRILSGYETEKVLENGDVFGNAILSMNSQQREEL